MQQKSKIFFNDSCSRDTALSTRYKHITRYFWSTCTCSYQPACWLLVASLISSTVAPTIMDFLRGMHRSGPPHLLTQVPTDNLTFTDYLIQNLSPNILKIFTSHTSIYWTLFKYALAARSYVQPLVTRLLGAPDILSFVLLAILLFISLKVFGMVRRMMMFWVNLGMTVGLWGGTALLGFWVYSRGVEGAVEDARGLWNICWGQYQHWRDQAEGNRGVKGRSGAGSSDEGRGWF